MKALSGPALVIGALLVGLALLLGLPFFGPQSWLSTGPLGAGIVLVAIGVVLSVRRQTRVGGAARLLLEGTLIFAAVVGVQAAALRMPMAVDLSSNKTNTLSEKSAAVVRTLKEPVVIYALMGRDDRAFVELGTLVERYQRESPQLKLIRDDLRPQLGEPNAVVVANERRAPIRIVAGSPDHEELVTNAIVQVTSKEQSRVYFLAGHGEGDLVDDGPDGLSRLRDALGMEGILPVPLPLSTTHAIPPDSAAVVIAGATSAVPAEDVKLVREWLDSGGRVMVLADPSVVTGLESLVGAYGIQLTEGAIVDTSPLSGLAGGTDTATGSQLEHAHPITRPLGEALTHFAGARALVENPGPTAKVTALVQTGEEARVGETEGPLVVAMAADDEVPTTLDGKPRHARLVVVGDSQFARNRGAQLGANQDLAVNAVLWLAEREDRIQIRPRGRGGALLLLTPSGRERLAFVLLYGLPVALVMCGFIARAWRRR